MTHTEVNRVKHLAKPFVEALKKISRAQPLGQEEMIKRAMESIAKREDGEYRLAYKKATRTIVAEPREWEWEVEEGEWCVYTNSVQKETCFLVIKPKTQNVGEIWLNNQAISASFLTKRDKCTPILGWEKIREIIKRYGYSMAITSGTKGGRIVVTKFGRALLPPFNSKETHNVYHKNHLQSAVMREVIKIAKELKDVKLAN